MYPSGKLWDYAQLGNILADTVNNHQDPGGRVAEAMKKFIDKYSKLAIESKPNEDCFTFTTRSFNPSVQKLP
jgi:hypothetical protein